MNIRTLKVGESVVAKLSLQKIADDILKNEKDFLNDDGFFDKEAICEQWELTPDEWKKLKPLID